ncbi:MAG: dihydroxyacetone kinase subunit L [Micrococcales bacterium]|nr:MAG: dihydroxyacetone kinase subunit L [Micrococcales bacterium]PIE26936.1 MAG: dihydroxyacetone kinase subunit L [Micrococcales bacterium]
MADGDQPVSQQHLATWIVNYAAVIDEQAAYLTELDSAIGDADHGANMKRGMAAAAEAVAAGGFPAIDAMMKKVGMTLVSTVGGASGPLYGTFFLRFGAAVAGKTELTAQELGAAMRAGYEGIVTRGKAQVQDKTMVDVWAPACEAYVQALAEKDNLASALAAMSEAARQGRDATVDLVAHKGRASYLGERSRGHMDPGAASSTMLIETAESTLVG